MPTARPLPDMHIAAARRRLAHLSGLEAGTEAAEQKIRDAAHARLEVVDAELAQARRGAMLHDRPAARYIELTEERGRLLETINRANAALGDGEEARDDAP